MGFNYNKLYIFAIGFADRFKNPGPCTFEDTFFFKRFNIDSKKKVIHKIPSVLYVFWYWY